MKRALDAPVFSAAPPGFVAAHEVSHSSPTPPALADIKDELYLTYPPMRLNAGYGEMLQRPSRFLTEVPTELREKWQVAERVGDCGRGLKAEISFGKRPFQVGVFLLPEDAAEHGVERVDVVIKPAVTGALRAAILWRFGVAGR